MHSLAVAAYEAQNIHGYQHGLSESAVVGQWKIEQNDFDGIVYISQNGGAWTPVGTGGGAGGSLNAAYIVGTTISVQNALGAVVFNTSQTSGTVFSITSTAPALVGTMTGIDMNLGAVVPGALGVVGLKITIPASTKADTAGEGALVISSSATRERMIDCSVLNTGAATGLWNLRWASATTLTATVFMLNLDGVTNVTAGASAFIGLKIATPAYTAAAAAGVGALVIDSRATVSRVIDCAVRNTSGTLVFLRYGAAVTYSISSTIGIDVDLITNVTPGALGTTALRLQVPATTKASTAGEGALVFDSRATAARVIDCAVRNTSATTGLWNLRYGAAAAAGAAIVGLNMDLTTNVTPGAQPFTGLLLTTPATTRAQTAGEGAVVIDSRATAARVLDIQCRNTGAAPGYIAIIRYGAATTLATGSVIGLTIDMSTNVTANAKTIGCLLVSLPDGSSTGSSCASFTSANTAGTGSVVSPTGALVFLNSTGTLTGPSNGFYSIYSVPNGQQVAAFNARIEAGGATTCACYMARPRSGAGIAFLEAAGTFHVLGPTNTASPLTLGAGAPTGTSNGNGITLTASDAVTAAGAQVGGGITLSEGAGAGGGARGTIAIGANVAAVLKFFNTGGATQQTIVGSRGGNAALADLLTKLALYGFIVDTTTA